MKKTLEQAVSRLRQLGTVLQENDRPAEALEAWKIAYNLMDDEVAEHPDGLWLVLAIAEQHYAKRDFETALVFYDEAYVSTMKPTASCPMTIPDMNCCSRGSLNAIRNSAMPTGHWNF